MKVCFFARVPHPEYLERIEFYAQDIRILKDAGHDVCIATRWNEIPANAELYFVWWWTWAFLPLAKAIFHGKPVIITGTFDHITHPQIRDFYRRPFWERLLIRLSLKLASANVFVSTKEFESVPRLVGCAMPVYSPHVVYTDEYTPIDAPKEEFIMTVSWLSHENVQRKCLQQVIQAIPLILEKYPNIKFLMVGEKVSGYASLQQLAHTLGISHAVEFTGVLSRTEKIKKMQRCSVYLQPSVYEGFGVAILEAMSCGAAVVSSPVGDVPEVVGDAGVLIDGTNPNAIAQAVIELLSNPQQIQNLSQKARERATTKFAYQRRFKDLTQLINKLTE